ncbi:N-acetylglucosamine kinase [Brevibacillus migulae]|uniref:N-acetylglucosamine kinase n=1 Tax=Brevibacillus migulae TaxID=1644114 RepID=UPI00106E599C|nr:BadF/BadG/BcrA/BcrD ATPase family protein [Brevibacillus migulae]
MRERKLPLLAVDGGGTKCLAVFADREEHILGQGRSGSCNYQGIGIEAASREITAAIRAAMEEVRQSEPQIAGDGPWKVECAVFGLAGLDTEHDRTILDAMIHNILAELDIQVDQLLVENDGFAALLGATGGEAGILVVAGTGSIAFGINEAGMTARAGGWGHRVGDEGSGYWIGKQAITAILKSADGREQATALTNEIHSYLGLANTDALVNWTYGPDYSIEKVAELSQLVSQAAEQGDKVAAGILRMAAEELVQTAKAVIDRLSLGPQRFAMVLQGGVLQNARMVRAYVEQQVKLYAPNVQIDTARRDPIYGVIAQGMFLLRHQKQDSEKEV